MNQAYASSICGGSLVGRRHSVVGGHCRGKALPSWIGVYGGIFSSLSVVALLSGYLPLDVHRFGLVALLQAIWFVSSGVQPGLVAGELRDGWHRVVTGLKYVMVLNGYC